MATGLKFIALLITTNNNTLHFSAFWTLGMGMTALLRATLFPILDKSGWIRIRSVYSVLQTRINVR